jgi:hypothetical protein
VKSNIGRLKLAHTVLIDWGRFSGHFLLSVGIVLGFSVSCGFPQRVEFQIRKLVTFLEENERYWVECYLTLTTNPLYVGH